MPSASWFQGAHHEAAAPRRPIVRRPLFPSPHCGWSHRRIIHPRRVVHSRIPRVYHFTSHSERQLHIRRSAVERLEAMYARDITTLLGSGIDLISSSWLLIARSLSKRLHNISTTTVTVNKQRRELGKSSCHARFSELCPPPVIRGYVRQGQPYRISLTLLHSLPRLSPHRSTIHSILYPPPTAPC